MSEQTAQSFSQVGSLLSLVIGKVGWILIELKKQNKTKASLSITEAHLEPFDSVSEATLYHLNLPQKPKTA